MRFPNALIALIFLTITTSGCMNVQRDDFKITALGQDISGTVEYGRINTNGTAEVFTFTGTKNASESTHTVANMVTAIVGAIIGGAGAGPGGAVAGGAKGFAIGGGTAEVWQTVKDWVKQKASGITKGK